MVVGFGVGFTASAGIMNLQLRIRQHGSEIRFRRPRFPALVRPGNDDSVIVWLICEKSNGFPMIPLTRFSSPGRYGSSAVAGHQDHVHLGPTLADLSRGFPSIHLRHRQIGKHQVTVVAGECLKAFAHCLPGSPVTHHLEHFRQRLSHRRFVINDQDRQRRHLQLSATISHRWPIQLQQPAGQL